MQFISTELSKWLTSLGIVTSHSSPYNPVGNEQCERYNSIIWKIVQLGLRTQCLNQRFWEKALPGALHSIRSLLFTSTNETSHERLFNFEQRSTSSMGLPTWLTEMGSKVLLLNFVCSKANPLVQEVKLLQANPNFAHVCYPSGRENTVSIKDLSPPARLLPCDDPTRPLDKAKPRQSQPPMDIKPHPSQPDLI